MDPDALVRLAAFRFLEEQILLAGEDGALPRAVLIAVLINGFVYEGQRVPLMGPQGIFKPRILLDMPLSITTVPIVDGQARPYEDALGPDGLLRYRYRGTDPRHHENVGLRLAMARRVPLIYFHGVVPGLYIAEWPVYVVSDDPLQLTFTVSVEERRFANLGSPPPETQETEIRRDM
jgi:putative restriction endonuclease